MIRLFVPKDVSALAVGADRVVKALTQQAGEGVQIVRTGSRGMTWLEPMIEVETPEGRIAYGPVTPADVPGLLAAGLLSGADHPLRIGRPEDHPFMVRQTRLTFARCGVIDPLNLDDYRAHGGLKGLERALSMTGAAMVDEVKASGLRIVENFLDMAHFPFVHTDVLGAEPHTEVQSYDVEIRREEDEVWATNCTFFQPQAALSASDGITTQYMYRVMTPFTTILYKTCPNSETRWDVIGLFVQPLDPDRCRAHPIMYLIDDVSTTTELIHFQQMIFLQDRIILENQRPVLLPLEPRKEVPTRADASSIAYRRWLKEKGVTYGATTVAA